MWLRWSTFVQAPNCKNRPQLKKITITNISFNTNWLYSCAEIQPTRRVICKKCCAALFIWDLKKTLVVIGKKIAWKFWICFLWKRSVSNSFTFFWKNVLNSSWVIFSSSSESKVKKLCILPALRLSECESWLTELSWAGQTVNPISTRGADYAHHTTMSMNPPPPPDFETLWRPWCSQI